MKSVIRYFHYKLLGAAIITREGICLLPSSRNFIMRQSSALSWRKYTARGNELLNTALATQQAVFTLLHGSESILPLSAYGDTNEEPTKSDAWTLDEDAEWLRQVMDLDPLLSLASQSPEAEKECSSREEAPLFTSSDAKLKEEGSVIDVKEPSMSGDGTRSDPKWNSNDYKKSIYKKSIPSQEMPENKELEESKYSSDPGFKSVVDRRSSVTAFPAPEQTSMTSNRGSSTLSNAKKRTPSSYTGNDAERSGTKKGSSKLREHSFISSSPSEEEYVDLDSNLKVGGSRMDEVAGGNRVPTGAKPKLGDKEDNDDVLTRSFMKSVEAKLMKLGYGEEINDFSTKEIDLILRNNLPAEKNNDKRVGRNSPTQRRERQSSRDRIPTRDQADIPAIRSSERRRQQRDSSSSRRREDARRRPVKKAGVNYASSEDAYLAGNKWWPGLESFGEALREETKMRSNILGPGFNKILKEEGKWRYDLYKAWLKLLKDGVGSDMDMVPPPSRYEDRSERPQRSSRPRRNP